MDQIRTGDLELPTNSVIGFYASEWQLFVIGAEMTCDMLSQASHIVQIH
jgi:hypothetical protein